MMRGPRWKRTARVDEYEQGVNEAGVNEHHAREVGLLSKAFMRRLLTTSTAAKGEGGMR